MARPQHAAAGAARVGGIGRRAGACAGRCSRPQRLRRRSSAIRCIANSWNGAPAAPRPRPAGNRSGRERAFDDKAARFGGPSGFRVMSRQLPCPECRIPAVPARPLNLCHVRPLARRAGGGRMASCRECRAQPHKIVYRLGFAARRDTFRAPPIKISEEVHVGSATFGHQNSRPDAGARWSPVGADAGRSRRRSDQDRTSRRRRRRPRLRPALPDRPRGQGEQQQLVLSLRQPQQEIRHRQYRHARRAGHRPRARQNLRRDDGELQGRRSQALPAGL